MNKIGLLSVLSCLLHIQLLCKFLFLFSISSVPTQKLATVQAVVMLFLSILIELQF